MRMMCAEFRKGQIPSTTFTVTTMNHFGLFSTKVFPFLGYSNNTVWFAHHPLCFLLSFPDAGVRGGVWWYLMFNRDVLAQGPPRLLLGLRCLILFNPPKKLWSETESRQRLSSLWTGTSMQSPRNILQSFGKWWLNLESCNASAIAWG